jgi:hypothetical protein
MIDWILNFRFNTPLAILLYWLPLVICVVGYTLRTVKEFHDDIDKRQEVELSNMQHRGYYPTLTVGHILGRALLTVIPVANLWAGMFDVGYDMLRGFFRWIGRVFDQPLVPKRDKTP